MSTTKSICLAEKSVFHFEFYHTQNGKIVFQFIRMHWLLSRYRDYRGIFSPVRFRYHRHQSLAANLYLLAFWTSPSADGSWCKSLSTQHDHIIPPEHESIGFPPANTQDILKPHSNRRPLYLHVCGITANFHKTNKFFFS